MIILLVYLVIGGLLTSGYVIGSLEQQKDIANIFKKNKLDKPYERFISGGISALALIIIWGPIVIAGITMRIIRHFNSY